MLLRIQCRNQQLEFHSDRLLAGELAEIVAGTRENSIRFDMSEYRQEHSDQRLIGPPPGYLGHLEGGQLTNWVLLRPYSEVIFDEIEKAHPKTMDMFLQVFDGGRLTSGMGRPWTSPIPS